MTTHVRVQNFQGGMTVVRVGETVGFKDDVEQYGRLERIEGMDLILSVYDGVTGEREERGVHFSQCFVEG